MQKVQRTPEHKKVLKLMIDEDVTQREVAEHLDVTPQAVNNRLQRGSVEPIIEAINEISESDEE